MERLEINLSPIKTNKEKEYQELIKFVNILSSKIKSYYKDTRTTINDNKLMSTEIKNISNSQSEELVKYIQESKESLNKINIDLHSFLSEVKDIILNMKNISKNNINKNIINIKSYNQIIPQTPSNNSIKNMRYINNINTEINSQSITFNSLLNSNCATTRNDNRMLNEIAYFSQSKINTIDYKSPKYKNNRQSFDYNNHTQNLYSPLTSTSLNKNNNKIIEQSIINLKKYYNIDKFGNVTNIELFSLVEEILKLLNEVLIVQGTSSISKKDLNQRTNLLNGIMNDLNLIIDNYKIKKEKNYYKLYKINKKNNTRPKSRNGLNEIVIDSYNSNSNSATNNNCRSYKVLKNISISNNNFSKKEDNENDNMAEINKLKEEIIQLKKENNNNIELIKSIKSDYLNKENNFNDKYNSLLNNYNLLNDHFNTNLYTVIDTCQIELLSQIDYKDEIFKLKEENKNIFNDNKKYINELNEVKNDIESIKTKENEYKKEIDLKNKLINDKENIINSLNDEINKYEIKINELEENSQRLNNLININAEKEKTENNNCKQEIENYNIKINDLNNLITEYKSKLLELENENKNLNNKNSKISNEMNDISNEINLINNKNTDIINKNIKLKENNNLLTQKLNELNSKLIQEINTNQSLNDKLKSIENINNLLKDKESEINKLNIKVNDLNNINNDLNNSLKEKDRLNVELNNKLKENYKRISELDNTLKEKENNINELKKNHNEIINPLILIDENTNNNIKNENLNENKKQNENILLLNNDISNISDILKKDSHSIDIKSNEHSGFIADLKNERSSISFNLCSNNENDIMNKLKILKKENEKFVKEIEKLKMERNTKSSHLSKIQLNFIREKEILNREIVNSKNKIDDLNEKIGIKTENINIQANKIESLTKQKNENDIKLDQYKEEIIKKDNNINILSKSNQILNEENSELKNKLSLRIKDLTKINNENDKLMQENKKLLNYFAEMNSDKNFLSRNKSEQLSGSFTCDNNSGNSKSIKESKDMKGLNSYKSSINLNINKNDKVIPFNKYEDLLDKFNEINTKYDKVLENYNKILKEKNYNKSDNISNVENNNDIINNNIQNNNNIIITTNINELLDKDKDKIIHYLEDKLLQVKTMFEIIIVDIGFNNKICHNVHQILILFGYSKEEAEQMYSKDKPKYFLFNKRSKSSKHVFK